MPQCPQYMVTSFAEVRMLKFVDALRVVPVFYAAAGYPLMILAACGQHKRSGPT